MSATGPVQHVAEALDLRCQVLGAVPYEETTVVSKFGVADIVHKVVIVISNDIVTRKAAAGYYAETYIGIAHGRKYAFPIRAVGGIQDHGERKGRALPIFALDDEPVVVAKDLLKDLHQKKVTQGSTASQSSPN